MKIKTVKEKACKFAKEHKAAIICGGCTAIVGSCCYLLGNRSGLKQGRDEAMESVQKAFRPLDLDDFWKMYWAANFSNGIVGYMGGNWKMSEAPELLKDLMDKSKKEAGDLSNFTLNGLMLFATENK